MAIQNINVAYIQPEDRVVMQVRVDPADEFRFWLTRACLCSFLPQVDQWLAGSDGDGQAAAAQLSFERQAAANEADFAVPFHGGDRFPLGEIPVLVQDIRLWTAGRSGHLDLQLVGGQSVTLTLDDEPLARLCRLVGEVAQSIGWREAASLGAASHQSQPAQLH